MPWNKVSMWNPAPSGTKIPTGLSGSGASELSGFRASEKVVDIFDLRESHHMSSEVKTVSGSGRTPMSVSSSPIGSRTNSKETHKIPPKSLSQERPLVKERNTTTRSSRALSSVNSKTTSRSGKDAQAQRERGIKCHHERVQTIPCREVDNMIESIQTQSLTIQSLERRLDHRVKDLQEDIRGLRNAFAQARKEEREARNQILGEVRTISRHVKDILQSDLYAPKVYPEAQHWNGDLAFADESSRGETYLTLQTLPQVSSSIHGPDFGSATLPIEIKDPLQTPLFTLPQQDAISTDPSDPSIFPIYTNEDRYHTAPNSPKIAYNNGILSPGSLKTLNAMWDMFANVNQEEITQSSESGSGILRESVIIQWIRLPSIRSGRSDQQQMFDSPQVDPTDYRDYTGPIRATKQGRSLRERNRTIGYVSHPMEPNAEINRFLAREWRHWRTR